MVGAEDKAACVAGTKVSPEDLEKIRVTQRTNRSSFELGMNREVSKNAELDRIADALLKSSVLKHDEIDEIVARRDLFSSVKRRVIAESKNRQSTPRTALILRPRVLSFAALSLVAVITMISAVEAIRNRTKSRPNGNQTVARHEQASPGTSPVIPAVAPPEKDEPISNIQQAVYKPSRPRPTTVKGPYHPVRNEAPEEPIEFYALADMNSGESVGGGRVVRVDLPRASLVSLGVNIPLGNDKQLIKADLLVGPDGVPRAIRLVE